MLDENKVTQKPDSVQTTRLVIILNNLVLQPKIIDFLGKVFRDKPSIIFCPIGNEEEEYLL
jgi:hypothetical protein